MSDEDTIRVEVSELQRLRRHAVLYERFISRLPDIFFLIGSDDRITDYRARDAADLYLPPQAFLGRVMRDLLPAEVAAAVGATLARARDSGAESSVEYSLEIGGQSRRFEMRCIPSDEREVTCFVRDITGNARDREALGQSVSLLRATLDATNDGILVVDLVGRIKTANRKFAELWRIPDELLERGDDSALIAFVIEQLIEPEPFVARLRDVYGKPAGHDFDTLLFKDGRIFERSSQPQRRGDEIVGRVWSFRDVTEQRRAEAERDRLLARTQEELRTRDEFLSIASHELRAPLTSLRLGLQVLRRLAASPAGLVDGQREQVAAALETSLRQERLLARLVEGLLSLARIRAGQIELTRAPVDLVAVAREVADDLREEGRRVGCDTVLIAAEPIVGRWDRGRLEQVLINLLTNAHRYAAGTRIELAVVADAGMASLSVRDHGPGIAPGMHERIFEPFERAVAPNHYGGLGLGLYIVRRLVEAHGGRVALASAPGEGATFVVTLPLDQP